MIGKLVICAVLCVAVSEVCLAESEQSQRVFNPFQSNEDVDTRISTCRYHLREAVSAISSLVYNFTSLFTEIMATVSDSVRCVFRPAELPSCVSGLVQDTFDGLFHAIKDMVYSIFNLLAMIMKGVVSCLIPIGYKQLLIAAESDIAF